MPLRPDGKVDEAAARHWVTTRLDVARRATRKEETSGGTVSDLRARKLSAEADLLEMKRRKRAAEARGVSRDIHRRAQGSD